MLVILQLGGPILGASLVVGVLVALFQAVTQINEATLAFLPKLAAIGLTMFLLAPFMTRTLTTFAHRVFDRIVVIGGT